MTMPRTFKPIPEWLNEKARATLLSRVEMIPESGCWIWVGAVDGSGYGKIKIASIEWKSHRLSYALFNGPIPDGFNVCHRCDVPSCANPEHLFVGTQSDNIMDMHVKRRQHLMLGVETNSAKLTEAQVLSIFKSTEVSSVPAKKYGITSAAVRAIRRRENWAWLTQGISR